jgi:peroxiredoxin
MPLLSPGDSFPALPLTPPGEPALTLPDGFNGNFGVALFFRGSWCRYCNAQLRAFQRASGTLAEAGIKVAVLSVDDEPDWRWPPPVQPRVGARGRQGDGGCRL